MVTWSGWITSTTCGLGTVGSVAAAMVDRYYRQETRGALQASGLFTSDFDIGRGHGSTSVADTDGLRPVVIGARRLTVINQAIRVKRWAGVRSNWSLM